MATTPLSNSDILPAGVGSQHGSAAVVTTTAAPGHWDAHSPAPGAQAAIAAESSVAAGAATLLEQRQPVGQQWHFCRQRRRRRLGALLSPTSRIHWFVRAIPMRSMAQRTALRSEPRPARAPVTPPQSRLELKATGAAVDRHTRTRRLSPAPPTGASQLPSSCSKTRSTAWKSSA